MKSFFIVIASLALLTAGVIFMFMEKELILIAAGVALAIWGLYTLWKAPRKHKEFSLHDQNEAANRARGGGGMPDISQLGPKEQKTKLRK
jgi:hypothetical protein